MFGVGRKPAVAPAFPSRRRASGRRAPLSVGTAPPGGAREAAGAAAWEEGWRRPGRPHLTPLPCAIRRGPSPRASLPCSLCRSRLLTTRGPRPSAAALPPLLPPAGWDPGPGVKLRPGKNFPPTLDPLLRLLRPPAPHLRASERHPCLCHAMLCHGPSPLPHRLLSPCSRLSCPGHRAGHGSCPRSAHTTDVLLSCRESPAHEGGYDGWSLPMLLPRSLSPSGPLRPCACSRGRSWAWNQVAPSAGGPVRGTLPVTPEGTHYSGVWPSPVATGSRWDSITGLFGDRTPHGALWRLAVSGGGCSRRRQGARGDC